MRLRVYKPGTKVSLNGRDEWRIIGFFVGDQDIQYLIRKIEEGRPTKIFIREFEMTVLDGTRREVELIDLGKEQL